MYFKYGKTETDHLKSCDKKMEFVINRIGFIQRPVIDDLFTCIIHKIIGQQISNEAQVTVFNKLKVLAGEITPDKIAGLSLEELQKCGMSFRKASYILNFTQSVVDGQMNLDAMLSMDDEQVIDELVKIKGIGKWTAEMTLISCLQRKNVISYGDLGIQKGLRMIYGKEEITEEFFEELKNRYSPYATIASFYIWRVSSGMIPELADPKLPVKRGKSKNVSFS